MVAEQAALIAALFVAFGEALHARRSRRIARLAFGPGERPAPWARLAPLLRVGAASALAWGLVTLMLVPPKVFVGETLAERERRHLLIVLDVSPSMRLQDAGPDRTQSRTARVASLMESFFRRVPAEQYLLSVVACYNGAKPVVVDAKDMEVIRNILHDLPMNYAFRVGKTDLFAGLEEAARIAPSLEPPKRDALAPFRRRYRARLGDAEAAGFESAMSWLSAWEIHAPARSSTAIFPVRMRQPFGRSPSA